MIDLTTAKLHLRLEHDDEDYLIEQVYLPAAIQSMIRYIGWSEVTGLLLEEKVEEIDQLILLESGGPLLAETPAMPRPVTMAMLLLTGSLYQSRGRESEIPPAAKALADPYRKEMFGGA